MKKQLWFIGTGTLLALASVIGFKSLPHPYCVVGMVAGITLLAAGVNFYFSGNITLYASLVSGLGAAAVFMTWYFTRSNPAISPFTATWTTVTLTLVSAIAFIAFLIQPRLPRATVHSW